MKDILILGASGFGREVKQTILDINRSYHGFYHYVPFNIIGFLDDKLTGQSFHGVPVLGGIKFLEEVNRDTLLVLGVSFPKVKRSFVEYAKGLGFQFATLVDPKALIGENCKLGEGVIVRAQSIITVDVILHDYVLVNINSYVGHESEIGRYSSISGGCNISGKVKIGEEVDVYASVTIHPGLNIGSWSVLGLGAGVLKDIPERSVAVGLPAIVKKTISQ